MSDALHRSHTTFDAKMDAYVKLRPFLKYISMRIKRLQMISEGEDHQARLGDTVANVLETSEAAAKPFGDEVLEFIHTKLDQHGVAFRSGDQKFKTDHIYGRIKERRDIHPMSNFGRLFRRQNTLLQRVGQDLESMSLIRYCDLFLLEEGEILEGELLPEEHPLLQLTNQSERALNSLRHLYIA